MKKLYALVALATLGISANAQQLVSEPFAFSGVVAGQNGWATHSGTGGQINTSTGSLSANGVTGTGNKITISSAAGQNEDINKAFTATPGVLYYSAIVNVLNTTALTANTGPGDYFLMLASMSTGTNPSLSNFVGRLYVRKGTATDTVNFGVMNNSGTPTGGATPAPTYASGDIAINTPVMVVVKVDQSVTPNNVSLFINPSNAAEPTTPSASNNAGTNTAPTTGLTNIAIRQSATTTSAGATGNIEIDEIKVSTTYSGLLATVDVNGKKVSLVKNTITDSAITFGAKADVKIYSVNGQLVKSAAVNDGSSVDVSSLAKGIYIVTGEVNGQKVSQKIIKK